MCSMQRLVLALFLTACAFAQSIPRPEYPQPQFQREQWISLNGEWEFAYDDKNVGIDEGWESRSTPLPKKIIVPFAPETQMSGIGDTSFHPYVWYRRVVTLPAAWNGKRVLLKFGAVDYEAKVWVNGRMAGEHVGGGVPFSLDVTHLLKQGPNAVVVRAEDQPTDRYQPRGKQYWEPKSRSIFYTRTTGIWQPVWLEAAGSSYLDRVRVTPSNDGVVRFDARVLRQTEGLEFRATVKRNGQALATATGMVRDARSGAAALIRNPALWSVNNPNLYDVTFELRDKSGAILDKVDSYFGFRQISVQDGRFRINGNPVYLKLVLDQGYWPESTLTPPSDEAIKFDINAMKEMGFNGARKHQKIEDPRFLYWADKLGFLVSGEIANSYMFDEVYVQRFVAEWIEAVERDYNHPSIVMWVPINESWGTPNLYDPKQQQHLRAMYTLTKSLDATRPVIDNDGWEHSDLTDLFAIHDYAANGEVLMSKYKDITTNSKFIPRNGKDAMAPGFQYNGTPLYLSEFGGIAYIKPGSNVPEESWGYAGVEKDEAAAFARVESLWNALAKMPNIIGICYTQLTDVEQEINGLLTYDRKPKFDFKKMRALNAMLN